MLGSPAATGPGGGGDRAATLWPPTPPASIYPPPHHHHQHSQHHTTISSGITTSTSVGATPLAAPACISSGTNNSSTAEAFSRYGLYSVFPGGAAAAAGAFYSHAAAATAGPFGRPPTAATYYAQHKLISETAGCYSFGAPTPPPGSPYSPLPVTHLELLAKSFNNNSIIIQQTPQDFTNTTLQQQQQQQQNITFNNNNIINTITNNNNNNYNNLKLHKDNNNTIITTDKQRMLVDEQIHQQQQPQQLKRWMNTCSTLSPLSVKTENNCYSPTINNNNNNCNTVKPLQRSVCACRNNNNNTSSTSPIIKNKFDNHLINSGGCSRTNPWTPSSTGGSTCNSGDKSILTSLGSGGGIGPIHIQVKREPATTPACQVAEITTSNNHTNTIVKVEAQSPNSVKTLSPTITDNTSSIVQTTMSSITTCTTGNGTIPVGIAVARQRLQQELTPTLQSTGGLLTTATGPAQLKEIDSASVAAAAMTVGVATNGGGSIVQCADDRTNSMTSWPLPSAHGSTLAAPTLWQYPAAPVPMEPMLPVPVPMPPVGFQLVRDPTTGHFFVIPTTSFDQLQQAVVWPSYPQPSSHVLLPPIPPPPLAPLQLLGSTTSDYLTTASTTLHQHTQTHSTRLVALTTDNNSKRKPMPLPSHTLIKIESDCTPSDQQATKQTLQTVSTMAATNTGCNAATMFADQSITPLLTTHVFYQHPTNLIQIAQPSVQPAVEAVCRSQATSPVACLTPPPETNMQESEDSTCIPGVQDASNQTDTPICSEDDNTIQNERDNYYIGPSSEVQTPLQQMQDLKIPVIVPPTSTIITSTPNNDVKIQISTAITTTQITEMRPCIPITIMSQMEPAKPSAKIVEIVEPESSTKEIDSSPAPPNTVDNDGGEQVVSTTTTSNTTYSNVDISGLELLSNSIVELENYRKSFDATPVKIEKDLDDEIVNNETQEEYQKTPGEDVVKKIADMSITDKNNKKGGDGSEVQDEQNDDLGGLGLLCALAEQRIMEEVTEKTIPTQPIKFEKHMDIDCKKKLKRCLEERYSLDSSNKKFKVGDFEFERKPQIKVIFEKDEKLCDNESKETTKDIEVEDKVKNNVPETIKPCCNKSDWTKMNELEKDMRLRLAELQRQCNEKQMELKKLTPQVDVIEQSKKPFRKSKSKSLDCERRSLSPPKLEKQEPILARTTTDLLKPPVLNTIGHNEKIYNDIIEHRNTETSHKRKLSPALSEVLSDSTTPFEKFSSSKKRKVGRPKKLSTPDLCEATEMIVAKKPKSLVGYLLAAKSRLHSQSKSCSNSSSPPRYNIEDSPSPKPKSKSHKKSKSISKSEKKKKSSSLDKKREKHNGSSKVRPKLKAEPKVKLFSDEDENSSSEWSPEDSSKMEDDDYEDGEDKDDTEVEDKNEDFDESSNVSAETETETKDMRCVLTAEHLEIDKLRVLTSMGGLFYAGVLSAIQAPDIYAITLDGERGNRPHIMSREEILRDAILEVSPATTQELLPGTRLCAYWSQQYRCLYPGTVAEPGTPDPTLDDRFVCVEFDDGDSGRIALEDIRLLQADYPIVEYDPNPLLSLSKRKRRISMNSNVEERRQNVQAINVSNTDSKTDIKIKSDSRNENRVSKQKSDKKHRNDKEHKERKKLKKHRRDKLKKLMRSGEEKKRKKKHKCCDEHCKHRRHHKKHRKHRKHHHSNKDKNGKINTTNNVTIIEDDPEDDGVEDDEQVFEQNVVQEEPSDSYEEENVVSEQDDAELDDNEENDDDDDDEEEREEEEGDEEEQGQDNNEDDDDLESDSGVSEKKSKKLRERQESVESRSKMAAFLPARQLWGWSGKGYKRPGAKGRARKQFFKTIQRGKETISVGDAAVFLSTGRPDRPYIGRIEAMWESLRNSMVVKVKWFYHPEETVGCPLNLQYPGALFESPHVDENDVQTISHKCEVLPLKDYTNKLGPDPQRYETIYDNNDIYYRAGYYDPTTLTLKMEPDIPLAVE